MSCHAYDAIVPRARIVRFGSRPVAWLVVRQGFTELTWELYKIDERCDRRLGYL